MQDKGYICQIQDQGYDVSFKDQGQRQGYRSLIKFHYYTIVYSYKVVYLLTKT